jgi:hypothetical protein
MQWALHIPYSKLIIHCVDYPLRWLSIALIILCIDYPLRWLSVALIIRCVDYPLRWLSIALIIHCVDYPLRWLGFWTPWAWLMAQMVKCTAPTATSTSRHTLYHKTVLNTYISMTGAACHCITAHCPKSILNTWRTPWFNLCIFQFMSRIIWATSFVTFKHGQFSFFIFREITKKSSFPSEKFSLFALETWLALSWL